MRRTACARMESGSVVMGLDEGNGNSFDETARALAHFEREAERLRQRNAQLEEQVRALVVLQGMANSLSAEVDLPSLLRRFAMAAVRLSSADVGAVYLVDPSANALIVEAIETAQTAADSGVFSGVNLLEVAHSGPREMIPRTGRPRIPLGEGVAGRVAASGEFVLVPNVSEDERFPPEVIASDVQVLGLKPASLLVVPMVFHRRVTGVLQVAQTGTAHGFDARSLDFMRTLATQAAVAVANAQLYYQLRNERDRVIEAQEEERRRISRELHDGPAQKMAQLAMSIEYARKLAVQAPDELLDELRAIHEQAVRTTRELRDLLFDLRPLALEAEHGGLVAALRSFLDRFQHVPGPMMHLDADYPERFSHNVELTAFAIIQEAVNNAVKHAAAQNCWIEVRGEANRLVARVRDDGKGFDVNTVKSQYDQRGSWGMLGMHERAALIDGTLTVASQPGKGTVVTLEAPR